MKDLVEASRSTEMKPHGASETHWSIPVHGCLLLLSATEEVGKQQGLFFFNSEKWKEKAQVGPCY